jgi:hypothetical protein
VAAVPQSTPLACTLLKSIRLPAVEAHVVKPDNAQRVVLAAAEQDRQSPSTGPVAVSSLGNLDGLMKTEDATYDQPKQSVDIKPGVLCPVDFTAKQPLSKLCIEDCMSKDKSEKPRERRRKGLGCDWCVDAPSERSSGSPSGKKRAKGSQPGPQLEHLLHELFRAHDLNGDNMLDENELIKLNEAVAEVHDSQDGEDVRNKYSVLFREKLDPEGNPVPYQKFRAYMLDMLDEIDRHENAQEMMVEQFLAEARLARTVVTGGPLLSDRPHHHACYDACLRFCPASEAVSEVRA